MSSTMQRKYHINNTHISKLNWFITALFFPLDHHLICCHPMHWCCTSDHLLGMVSTKKSIEISYIINIILRKNNYCVVTKMKTKPKWLDEYWERAEKVQEALKSHTKLKWQKKPLSPFQYLSLPLKKKIDVCVWQGHCFQCCSHGCFLPSSLNKERGHPRHSFCRIYYTPYI